MTIIKQNRVTVWYQPDGEGNAFSVLGIGEKGVGMTGKSIPGSDRSPVYGRDSGGRPIVIAQNESPPGDSPSATIQLYERGGVDFLLKALQGGCPINVQTRANSCGSLNNPNAWDYIEHWSSGKITDYSPGDAPSIEFAGESIVNEGTFSFQHVIRILRTSLSSLTTTETMNLLGITGLSDETCNECNVGYPGADKILFVGAAADAAAEANVLYTTNGGSSWAATSATPFSAGNYEDATYIDCFFVSKDQIRVLIGTGSSVVGTKAQTAWADVTLGAEGTTSWTVVTLSGTATGDTITAMKALSYDRVMAASAGDIYLSEDQGASYGATALYTGSTAINGFAIAPDGEEAWAFGASNLILRELNTSGLFETRVGPSGGGAFTAMTVAGNGFVYAGNGTSIYVTKNKAANAGGWTSLKDFGSNKVVKAIQCIGGDRALGGDSQLLRVVVDDTAGGNGTIWESFDGGASWQQVTALTNLGYNAAYFSQVDDNRAVVVGDAVGGYGVIHNLAPSA